MEKDCSRLDALFDRVANYRVSGREDVLDVGTRLLSVSKVRSGVNYWKEIISTNNIKCDRRLYELCLQESRNVIKQGDFIRQEYLDTVQVNEDKSYHKFLLSRASTETLSFGNMPLYHWFSFFCQLCGNNLIENRLIAGLCQQVKYDPFLIRRSEYSQLVYVNGFYNISNIIECLLNIAELRLGLWKYQLNLSGKKIDLGKVLDEIALYGAINPKKFIKTVRAHLTMCIRFAGVRSTNPMTYEHDASYGNDVHFYVNKKCVDPNRMKPFFYNENHTQTYNSGSCDLKNTKCIKLFELTEAVLDMSLFDTSKDDFIIASSFLNNVMKIAGYGRAFKYATCPRSAEEKVEDKLNISNELNKTLNIVHNKAVDSGFSRCTPDDWEQRCAGFWKSTSAGISPAKVTLHINGKEKKVSVRKKLGIAMALGNRAFSRKELSRKLTKENPGSVGYRDVPYKPTRAIYVLPLGTIHAQVAVTSHLVRYVGSDGHNESAADTQVDASHFFAGSSSTSGVRIFDNYSTIRISGNSDQISVDIDLSQFDSHNVIWNFRNPILEFLNSLDFEDSTVKFGPDKLNYHELVKYAFDEGYVKNSFWDNGRQVYLRYRKDNIIEVNDLKIIDIKIRKYFEISVVDKDNSSLNPMIGVKKCSPGTYALLKEEYYTEIPEDIIDFLEPVWIQDGRDLVFLTSEASGELTTMLYNTIMNLAMQNIILSKIKETKFGRRLVPRVKRAVGDDSEWECDIDYNSLTCEEVDEFIKWLKATYYDMGHLFSEFKFFFLPYSAEFVQTYARFGLYIPKDQIMIIASEKPRRILDPESFMMSFKRVLLTKCSRGYNETFAYLLIILNYKWLMRIDIRRRLLKIGKIWYPTIVGMDRQSIIKAKEIEFVGGPYTFQEFKDLSKQTNDKNNVTIDETENEHKVANNRKFGIYEFELGVINIYFPTNAHGLGINWRSLILVNTSALFNKIYSNCTNVLTAYHYVRSKNWSFKTEDENSINFVKSENTLDYRRLYRSDVIESLDKMKDFSIGRLDAENLPYNMLKEGVKLEPFMREVHFDKKEKNTIMILKSIHKDVNFKAFNSDEWLLTFIYNYNEKIINQGERETFIGGLHPRITLISEKRGFSNDSSRLQIGMEIMRRIISKDPTLRGSVGPEEVYTLLNKYGISSELDRDFGLILLMRMGFIRSVAMEILTQVINGDVTLNLETADGALTDDVSLQYGLLGKDRFLNTHFPNSLDNGDLYSMKIFIQQYGIYLAMGVDNKCNYECDSITINTLNEIRRFFSRTYNDVTKRRKSAWKILSSLLTDIRDRL